MKLHSLMWHVGGIVWRIGFLKYFEKIMDRSELIVHESLNTEVEQNPNFQTILLTL